MTPIKNAVIKYSEGIFALHNFSILFKIGNISLISEKFTLVSTIHQVYFLEKIL